MPDKRPIDMQALRVFLAAAEDCSMSKAAKRLGISQSAVSQSVRLLEDSFGSPLLNRSSRPLTLTAAGAALYQRGRVLLEQALNLRGAVIEASRGIKPSLRLGLVDSFAATCGTTLVQQLLHDTAQLSVRTGLTPKLAGELGRRELDLAISTRVLGLDGLTDHRLVTERFLVIAPRDGGPACQSVADLIALARVLPIVRFNRQSHLGEQVDKALRRIGLDPPRRLEVDTADTLTSMVAGGIGWAVTTPLCLLQGARSASAVRHHLVPSFRAERTIFLHVRHDEYGSLGRDIFERTCDILRTLTTAELQAINPALPALLRIHGWGETG